eukprot:5923686-Amphidinium_carterae.1
MTSKGIYNSELMLFDVMKRYLPTESFLKLGVVKQSPGLTNPGQKPVQAKDAVHEVEWDGRDGLPFITRQQIGDRQCL